jgi:hypothetical protein
MIRVVASFKPIASAVRLDGRGDGGEMVLAFDRSQMAAVLEAWAMYADAAFVIAFDPPGDVEA